MKSPFISLQEKIADRLLANDFPCKVLCESGLKEPIITEGLYLYVRLPQPGKSAVYFKKPFFEHVKLPVELVVSSYWLKNNVSPLSIAERVIATLQGWMPDMPGVLSSLRFGEWSLKEDKNSGGKWVYQLPFYVTFDLNITDENNT